MSDTKDEKRARLLVRNLIIATATLSVLCAILSTHLYNRPVVEITRTIQAEPTDQVIFEFGDGRRVIAPKDGVIEFEGDLKELVESTDKKRTDEATGKGVDITTYGTEHGKIVLELDFGSPETHIAGGATSIAGWANLGVKAIVTSSPVILYVIGAGFIGIGVVVMVWLKRFKLGGGFIAAGFSLIIVVNLVEKYPWVFMLLLLSIVAIIGFVLYDYWRGKQAQDSADAIIAAGENLPGKAKSLFKKLVHEEANMRGVGKTVRKVVDAAKEKNGRPMARVDTESHEKDLRDELIKRHGTGDGGNQPQPQVIIVPSDQINPTAI
jgi:hypothetical protein